MRIELRTERREQLVDITAEVRRIVGASGVTDGTVLIYCTHTTAGVTINEAADPDVCADILVGLTRLVPEHSGWRHAEGNSDAHIKATIVGASALVPVIAGELALGTWQGIFFCEFDGPRRRSLLVTVSGEKHS